MGVKSRGVKRRGVRSRGVKRRGVKSRVTNETHLINPNNRPFCPSVLREDRETHRSQCTGPVCLIFDSYDESDQNIKSQTWKSRNKRYSYPVQLDTKNKLEGNKTQRFAIPSVQQTSPYLLTFSERCS